MATPQIRTHRIRIVNFINWHCDRWGRPESLWSFCTLTKFSRKSVTQTSWLLDLVCAKKCLTMNVRWYCRPQSEFEAFLNTGTWLKRFLQWNLAFHLILVLRSNSLDKLIGKSITDIMLSMGLCDWHTVVSVGLQICWVSGVEIPICRQVNDWDIVEIASLVHGKLWNSFG
jgi:hypothetical protein